MKLSTPFGEASIFIDDKEIEYNFVKLKPFKNCPDIDGRYVIEIDFKPDGKEHKISCEISNIDSNFETDFESGERLECRSFYSGNIKMSIGCEGDNWYDPDGTRDSLYDYDVDYLDNGMAYSILPFTKTEKYIFVLSWILSCNNENDVQTWFAADPFYYKKGY